MPICPFLHVFYLSFLHAGAPVFIDPPVSSSVVKGNGVEMKCTVEGDPFPQITWLLDNVIVVPDETLIMR